jgi:uncharacterized protein with HEPN domain
MRGELGDKARLRHISEAIDKIESFVSDTTEQEFLHDEIKVLACQRLLEIIGEAARCLTAEFKNQHQQIEWRKIIGLRNIMAHQYFEVSDVIIWQVIKIDLPQLKSEIERALSALS